MKRNYWPLLFIGLFSFSFGMIIWTINSAIKVPVHEDETFLKRYHDLDENYNNVVESNTNFKKKFNLKVRINERDFGLEFKDIFLSQRVIEKKSTNKDLFKLTNNNIEISIEEKKSQRLIKNVDIELRLSRPTNHHSTLDFSQKDFITKDGINSLNVDLPLKGNWNITGQFKVGNDIGYFYLKSNAI